MLYSHGHNFCKYPRASRTFAYWPPTWKLSLDPISCPATVLCRVPNAFRRVIHAITMPPSPLSFSCWYAPPAECYAHPLPRRKVRGSHLFCQLPRSWRKKNKENDHLNEKKIAYFLSPWLNKSELFCKTLPWLIVYTAHLEIFLKTSSLPLRLSRQQMNIPNRK